MTNDLLYFLEWDNGQEYEDREVVLLGVYSDPTKRAEARTRYSSEKAKKWPFCGRREEGKFVEYDIPLDEDWYDT